MNSSADIHTTYVMPYE